MENNPKNPCRTCLVGEHHYKVTCNNCKSRISRAKGLIPEILAKLTIENN